VTPVVEIEREIREWAAGVRWDTIPLVVAVGLGRGVTHQVIREFTAAPIYLYDPRAPGNGPVDNTENVVVFKDLPALRSAMRDASWVLDSEPVIVHCDTADPELTGEVEEHVQRIWEEADLGACLGRQTAELSMLTRTKAFAEQLPMMADATPINHLEGSLSGVPAIIVGAGPSLDRQIDELKEIADLALVVAVNTSASALHAAGIMPDIVVVCETKDVAETIPAEVLEHSMIVPGLHVNPATFTLPKLVAPALSNEGPFGTWLCKLCEVDPIGIGGSAATLGAAVALHLGCDPLVLVGNDCCVSPEGELYSKHSAFAGTTVETTETTTVIHRSDAKAKADGSLDECPRIEHPQPAVWVESWDGEGEVCCPPAYDGLRQWWEEAATGKCWKDHRLINASVGGARLWGWEPLRLNEIDWPVSVDLPRDRLREAHKAAAALPRGMLREAILDERAGAKKSRKLCDEGVELLERMREIQCELAENSSSATILDSYTWGDFERDRREGDREPVLERMAVLLKDLRTGADGLDDIFSKVLGSL